MLYALLAIIGILIRAGQIMAIVVCCKAQSPKWLKVRGAIGAILFTMAYVGNYID